MPLPGQAKLWIFNFSTRWGTKKVRLLNALNRKPIVNHTKSGLHAEGFHF